MDPWGCLWTWLPLPCGPALWFLLPSLSSLCPHTFLDHLYMESSSNQFNGVLGSCSSSFLRNMHLGTTLSFHRMSDGIMIDVFGINILCTSCSHSILLPRNISLSQPVYFYFLVIIFFLAFIKVEEKCLSIHKLPCSSWPKPSLWYPLSTTFHLLLSSSPVFLDLRADTFSCIILHCIWSEKALKYLIDHVSSSPVTRMNMSLPVIPQHNIATSVMSTFADARHQSSLESKKKKYLFEKEDLPDGCPSASVESPFHA